MRANTVMLAPISAQFDQILRTLSKFFRIAMPDVFYECIRVEHVLRDSKFAHLRRRQRLKSYVEPSFCFRCAYSFFLAIHDRVCKRFGRGLGCRRIRDRQVLFN